MFLSFLPQKGGNFLDLGLSEAQSSIPGLLCLGKAYTSWISQAKWFSLQSHGHLQETAGGSSGKGKLSFEPVPTRPSLKDFRPTGVPHSSSQAVWEPGHRICDSKSESTPLHRSVYNSPLEPVGDSNSVLNYIDRMLKSDFYDVIL